MSIEFMVIITAAVQEQYPDAAVTPTVYGKSNDEI